jgi:bifunctional DNA-binding transcriptional regulator/antitoxin component of YhaV-PrlF toxin-antitoxin module
MNVIVDPSGRIELPDVLRAQWGLKSGDEIVIEEENGRWVIKPARQAEPLQWEGNVLVHNGVLLANDAEILDQIRRERHDDLLGGEST